MRTEEGRSAWTGEAGYGFWRKWGRIRTGRGKAFSVGGKALGRLRSRHEISCLEVSGGAGQGGTWRGVSWLGSQTPGTPWPEVAFLFFFLGGELGAFLLPEAPFPFQRAVLYLQSEGLNQGGLFRL